MVEAGNLMEGAMVEAKNLLECERIASENLRDKALVEAGNLMEGAMVEAKNLMESAIVETENLLRDVMVETENLLGDAMRFATKNLKESVVIEIDNMKKNGRTDVENLKRTAMITSENLMDSARITNENLKRTAIITADNLKRTAMGASENLIESARITADNLKGIVNLTPEHLQKNAIRVSENLQKNAMHLSKNLKRTAMGASENLIESARITADNLKRTAMGASENLIESARITSENLKRTAIITVENLIEDFYTQIVQANKQNDEFSSILSHELSTPLFPIKFYAEMLRDPKIFGNLNKDQLNSVNEIYNNSVKLEKLINDIFDVQKFETGKMKFAETSFDLDKFMEKIENDNLSLMVKKQIKFINSTKDKMVVTSDSDRLVQVFANLIENSVDFVPDKTGIIEINAKVEGNDILFCVKDNGSGIPKDKQVNLFKKFYQMDVSSSRKHGGSGLGLALCKGIIEGLGGKMWLESAVNVGTIIYFTIPITK